MNIPGVGTVKENMEKATRSMLPTQMTIMPRDQLQIHKDWFCVQYRILTQHRQGMYPILAPFRIGIVRNNHVAL